MTDDAHPLKNGRRTLAVLGVSMGSPFSSSIAMGASDFARQYGCNLISFAGGPPNSPDVTAQGRSRLFEVISPDLYDGFILPLGSLSRYITPEQIQDFLRPFRGKPIVTVGTPQDDTLSVVVDNQSGMREIVKHLIEVHGYRHIAFASGPINHYSSNDKLNTYIRTLQECGLSYDPNYVVHGDLTRNTTDWCVNTLLDERGLTVDAIVTVNDTQAFAIVEYIKERGLRVPEDIAVTGCMDTLECSISQPSLTTIHEPMHELGWMAAQAVMEALDGGDWCKKYYAPTSIRVRKSCGCNSRQINKYNQHTTSIDHKIWHSHTPQSSSLFEKIQATRQHDNKATTLGISASDLDTLLTQIDACHDAYSIELALLKLESIVEKQICNPSINRWLSIILVVQHHLVTQFTQRGDPSNAELVSEICENMHATLSQNALTYLSVSIDKSIDAFRELSITLNALFDVEVIRRILVRELKVSECYISLYLDNANVSGDVKNILAIQQRQLVLLDECHQRYASSQLIPQAAGSADHAYCFMVLPMSFRAEPIGYIVVDPFNRKGVVYENMQALLASALKNEIQIHELIEAEAAEEKFSDIAFSASDWIWETDEQGRYTFCSHGMIDVLGYSAQEVIGRSIFEFVLPSESHYLKHVRDHLFPNRLPLSNIEHVSQHKDGHEVHLLISGRPIIKNGQLLGYRGSCKDTTAIKEQENKIRQLADTDTLTGLANRMLFNERLHMSVISAQRDAQHFAVLFLDLDGFKQINDTFGHAIGDKLLQEVARSLQIHIRESDTLARLGGDEFTILISHINQAEDAALVAKNITRIFSKPFSIDGHEVKVTTSIGIAIYPSDASSANTLMINADKAMYKAKQLGKNRYVLFDIEMDEKSHKRMKHEALLHQALQESLFELHYQALFNAQTGEIWGAEALLRINKTELLTLPTVELIQLAEDLNLIGEIGVWVFTNVCQKLKHLQSLGLDIKLAINLSARQLCKKNAAEQLINLAQEYGISPCKLILEITEKSVIENADTIKTQLKKLHQAGFPITIDDFGTGYSSLSILNEFPIDTVKIDCSLIKRAAPDNVCAKTISAIIQIANSLQLQLIAEGVETTMQRDLLQSLGCTQMQGYYFSRPLPDQALNEFLLKHITLQQ